MQKLFGIGTYNLIHLPLPITKKMTFLLTYLELEGFTKKRAELVGLEIIPETSICKEKAIKGCQFVEVTKRPQFGLDKMALVALFKEITEACDFQRSDVLRNSVGKKEAVYVVEVTPEKRRFVTVLPENLLRI